MFDSASPREADIAIRCRLERHMPAFGHEHDFVAAPRDSLADQYLAVCVAFGRIDHVDAGVEGPVEDFIDGLLRYFLVADFRTTEA